MSVPVLECGEPLVDLRTVEALLLASPSAATPVRIGVLDRLITAQTLLPAGLRLRIGGYACVPHAEGAAADVTLSTVDGRVVGVARLLGDALRTAGMVNHPLRPWHWSYGDRHWAVVTGAPAARYGPAEAL